MGEKRHSYGTLLGYANAGTAAGGSFTDIAGVISIDHDGVSTTETDATDLQSPSAAMEFIPGLANAGTLSLELHADDSVVNTLYGFYRTTKAFELTWPELSGESTVQPNWVCDGFISNIGQGIPQDDKIVLPIDIKLTGKPTFTVGS